MAKITDINTQYIVLEKLKVRAAERISDAVARSMTLHQWQDFMGRELDAMILEIRAHVMAHKLVEEDVTAPWETRVVAEAHTERHWMAILPASGILVTCVAAAMAGSIVIWLVAALWASLAVTQYAMNPPEHVRVEKVARGEVVVPVASYATFPELAYDYPDRMGPVYLAQHVQEPQSRRYNDDAPQQTSVDRPTPARKEFPVVRRLETLEWAHEEYTRWLKGRTQPDHPDKWVADLYLSVYEDMHRHAKEEVRRRHGG